MTQHKARWGFGVCLLGLSAVAQAVDPQPLNPDDPIVLIPTVKLSQGYDDNVDRVPEGSEEGSTVTTVEPDLRFVARAGQDSYEFRYTPVFKYYGSSNFDDRNEVRNNQSLNLNGSAALNRRNSVDISLGFQREESEITDTNKVTRLNPSFEEETEGDIRQAYRAGLTHTLGADGAKGRLTTGVSHLWNRYRTNLTTLSNNQSKEYDNLSLSSTFYWSVSDKTELLVGGRYGEFDYLWSESRLNNDVVSGFVGATWNMSAKTTGRLRVGQTEKRFERNSQRDNDAASWNASLVWQPLQRSAVTLSTSGDMVEGRQRLEGSILEDTVEQSTYGVSWRHEWNSRLQSRLGYAVQDKDFVGGENDGRNDEVSTISVGLDYAFQRWFDIGFEARFSEGESSAEVNNYERATYFLTATMSL